METEIISDEDIADVAATKKVAEIFFDRLVRGRDNLTLSIGHDVLEVGMLQKALMEELVAVKTRQEEFFSNQTNQYNMIRQEQNLLGKEILDVKKHQMNTVIIGSSSSPQKYEPDQALMKIRDQHANFSEVQRQLKE
ncbi:hypothetical protein PIB30_101531 [Stylosanthes scabra]|uniref:Uncharacterized protein n=1 Tax=Stylosanthes scabra TaxID=79078 RepID=A0ABU6VXX8_9FABA|nr:hypothetical protein [Stylosanthes scabra]